MEKKKFIKNDLTKTIIVLIIVNIIIMTILTILSPSFLSYGNLSSVMKRMGELALLAIAETIVFISGGFDLSIGSIMALSGVTTGTLYNFGLPFSIAVIAGLAAGVVVGIINATLVVKLKLQPFIVTLATMNIVRSVVYGILRGDTLTNFPDSFLAIGDVYILKIPLLFIIVVIIAIAFSLLLRKTTIGRYFYALGGNEKTAYISGVFVNRIKYLVYILSGLICAFAGILFVIRIRAAIPNAGLNAPLEVVTAVLIGGTLITGGKGGILGSFLGILAMYLLTNGFSLLGLNPFWQQIVLGGILIYVVGREGFKNMFSGILPKKRQVTQVEES